MLHVVQKGLFSRADPFRGRFRSFLLGALVRFLADVRDRHLALKRGGRLAHISLEEWSETGPHSVHPPDFVLAFDRGWAVALLEAALARVRAEYAAENKADQFLALVRFLPGAGAPPPYEEGARESDLSLPAFKSELHRFRMRIRTALREDIAQTVSAPHEIEVEFGHLREVLMDRSHAFPSGLREGFNPPETRPD
jgi:RNA polymerase sigma-70 factor (ECF subfamily)